MTDKQTREILEQIKAHDRRRVAMMKIVAANERRVESYVRGLFGWNPTMGKDHPLVKQAAAAIKAALNEGEADGLGPQDVDLILATKDSAKPFERGRKDAEKAMESLVKKLPFWPWVESVRGLGALSAATIIAETGLGNNGQGIAAFSPRSLRQRLGAAPDEAYPESDKGIRMIPRHRRARVSTIVGMLLRNNDGGYREIYDRERAKTYAGYDEKSRKISAVTGKPQLTAHDDLKARRKATAALLNDFWAAWTGGEIRGSSTPPQAAE